MSELYYMDIPATNVTAQYPTDGAGGITATAGSAMSTSPDGQIIRNFRVLGIQPTGTPPASTNNVTVTTNAGATSVTVLPSSATGGGYYSLPEQAGITAANEAVYTPLGAMIDRTAVWPSNIDQGMACGKSFTVTQSNAVTWALRIWFSADVAAGSSVLVPA